VKARQCNTQRSKFAIMMKSTTRIYWYFIKQYILGPIQLYHRNSYTASFYPPFFIIIPAYINRYIYVCIYMCLSIFLFVAFGNIKEIWNIEINICELFYLYC